MRFWRLILAGRFKTAWGHLSRRPDSEHEQALIRVVITGIVFIYLCVYWEVTHGGRITPEEQRVLWTSAFYHVFSVGLFFLITIEPGISPSRRYLGIVGDLSLPAYGVSVVGGASAPLYVIMLWVIFGNGFRYGRRYLFVSAVIGTIGFGVAVSLNEFWRDKHLMGGGLLIGLIVLPVYVSALLKKLTAAGQRAEDANKAKNRFLANMSHEMRTPLNGIIGLIDLLKGTPLTAEQEELTKTVDASARTLLFLMQDVLDLSKIESGKVSVQVSDFDLHGLVKNTVAIMEPQARAKGLDLFRHVPANVPFLLRGDPLLLRQVLLNLLGNAVKFTEKGEVGVRVALESESHGHATVRFEVVDTGIGIAPEAQRRIFERFAQADDSITRRYGGTGLGTTISKEIVELMGGSIGLRSVPGQGSTFWFTVEMQKQRVEQAEAAAVAALSERRSLIVSSDPDITESVRDHLATWGVRAVSVDRSAQAFAQLVSAANVGVPFDFVVVAELGLDMALEGFARGIRSDPTLQQTQLVLVTEGWKDADEFARIGYGAVLPAPVNRTMLFNALHLSRPDAAAGDPSVGNISERYRQRQSEGRKLRVLVAEDNRTNQMVISKILERAGHEVTLAGDGEQALEALKTRSFDITLMDLHMPTMGGVEAAKLYRFMSRGGHRMPIVALTADATPEARAECEEAGMEACLTKPIDTRKLFELLEELVPGALRHPQEVGVPEGESRRPDGEAGSAERRAGVKAPEAAPCLDPKILRELAELGGNSDFVVRLVWTYLKGARERTRDLEKAVAECDVEKARTVAHALKGNSGQIGAYALMEACDRFSGIGASELERSGWEYLEAVREELGRARVALDRFLSGKNSAVS